MKIKGGKIKTTKGSRRPVERELKIEVRKGNKENTRKHPRLLLNL